MEKWCLYCCKYIKIYTMTYRVSHGESRFAIYLMKFLELPRWTRNAKSRPFVIADRFRTSWQSPSSPLCLLSWGDRRRRKRDRATGKKKERERKSVWPPLSRCQWGRRDGPESNVRLPGPRTSRAPDSLSFSPPLLLLFSLFPSPLFSTLRFPFCGTLETFFYPQSNDSLSYLVS